MTGTPSPKIIGFCGYPGSGKDAAASFLVARGWQRIAFADKLREMALAIDPIVMPDAHGIGRSPDNPSGPLPRLSLIVEKFGWVEAKKHPEVRRLLQHIGTQAVRDIIGPDTWVQLAEQQIEVGKRVVITDVRFANEAEMIRRRGGMLCRVFRRESTEKFQNCEHASEQYPFLHDCHIDNNGTLAELENQVLELAGYSPFWLAHDFGMWLSGANRHKSPAGN